MELTTALRLTLINLLSFYAYPVAAFHISPLVTALAAGLFLLGAAAQDSLCRRKKRTAWFPVLCIFVTAVSFSLLCLIDVRNRLAGRGDVIIPVGWGMIVFSVAASYVLLGSLIGRLIYGIFRKICSGKEMDKT